MRHSILALLLLVALAACADNPVAGDAPDRPALRLSDLDGAPFGAPALTDLTADDAAARARALFPDAVVREVERDDERGLSVWEVELRLPSGASLEVYLAAADGRLVKAEGERGPFTYRFAPGDDFIPLADALAAVDGTPELTEWELELDDDVRWIYELDVRRDGAAWEAEVDARTGTLLELERDDDADDDDADDDRSDDD